MSALLCASPSCAATILDAPTLAPSIRRRRLLRLGWALERQEGDDRPRWYCPRCVL